MTQDIIEMARQVGLCRTQSKFDDWIDAGPSGYELEHFARLVAKAEREACAKVCESINSHEDYYGERIELACAEAIRARGQE